MTPNKAPLNSFLLTMLGIFSIGIVIPKEKINLTIAVMEAISQYLKNFHLDWMLFPFSLMIALGALGGVSSWLIGTSKGLLFASEDENLPSRLFTLNRHEVPVFLVIAQAAVVSLLSFLFIAMPSLSSAFWILTALASQLYLITYVLMFLAGIILRFKKPLVPREYLIPGGKGGMLLVAGIGLCSCILAFFIGFIPPLQIQVRNVFLYEVFLIAGIALCSLVPFILLKNSSARRASDKELS